jgi:prephenate dehydrogenase
MAFETLSIVGVGLIGGSIGLAAKERGVARRVVGIGRDERNLSRAQAAGAIDQFTTKLTDGVAEADFVVVCTPVDRVAADVVAAAHAAPVRCLITDAGSTKGNILAGIHGKMPHEGPEFIGSHPLAGSEKRGSANSKPEMFDGRLVVVTPTRESDPEAIAVVELFWSRLGARTMRMDAHEHDRALAMTSHLPHAAASALAGITPLEWLTLTAGGFRDTTRIAGGDAELWAAIFEANRDAVLGALDQYLERLGSFRQMLAGGAHAELVQWLSEGKKVRDALGS